MDELFGAPIESIAIVLGAMFALIAAFLAFIGLRDPILVRMAFRNVRRRPARSALIITGLMLATASNPPRGTVRPEWRSFHERGLAPALNKLDYIYRAVTPPGSPRRFNARFFMAFADDVHGEIASNGELHDIAWVPIPEALQMPIPHITSVVLCEIDRLLRNPKPRDAVQPTPYFHRVGKKYLLKME